MTARPFLLLFLLGTAIRFVGVLRPIDLPNWRECDVAAIARNYLREDANLFYPRIDWRGDGPGFVESEFPIYPWTTALLYRAFGMHDWIPRGLSLLISFGSMAAFFGLARRLLPPAGAVIASLFFVLSPLAVLVGYSIQPEGLMFCAYLAAAYVFLRWMEDDSARFYWMAVAATAVAVLAKITAAHIGIFFAMELVRRRGLWPAIRSARSWMFAVFALAPGALWYAHAKGLYTTYGNSLGFSNEDHWARWDLFTKPVLTGGIVAVDLWFVWVLAGVLIAVYGLGRNRSAPVVPFALMWLTASGIYYLVAARTLSALWANYYHLASVAPAALLVGHGAVRARDGARGRIGAYVIGALAAAAGWVVVSEVVHRYAARFADRITGVPLLPAAVIAGLALIAALVAFAFCKGSVSWGVALLLSAGLFFEGAIVAVQLRYGTGRERYVCAQRFAPLVPAGTLIAASGGFRIGPTGRPAASDAPYMFYWMDRKGFSIANEDQSVASLERVATRGARYFVAEKDAVATAPGFETALKGRYKLVDECSTAWLFEISR